MKRSIEMLRLDIRYVCKLNPSVRSKAPNPTRSVDATAPSHCSTRIVFSRVACSNRSGVAAASEAVVETRTTESPNPKQQKEQQRRESKPGSWPQQRPRWRRDGKKAHRTHLRSPRTRGRRSWSAGTRRRPPRRGAACPPWAWPAWRSSCAPRRRPHSASRSPFSGAHSHRTGVSCRWRSRFTRGR